MLLIQKDIFRYIVQNSTNGIIILDTNLKIIYANSAAGEILSYDHNHLINRFVGEFVPKEPYISLLKDGQRQISQKNLYKGKNIIVDRIPMTYGGKIHGIISIFQDVSKYEAIVQELEEYKELNNRFQSVINSSYDGIYVTDGQANTILVNQAYERITGIKSGDIMGRNMKVLVEEGYFSESGSLKAIERGEIVNIRQQLSSGKEVLITSTPVRDNAGEIIYVITNVRDISDLVNLQNEVSKIKALNERYKSEIEVIKRELNNSSQMIVKDSKTINVIETVLRVSRVDTTVLVLGETGVGKGEIAKLIHKNSPRKREKFIEVNCGAIPQTLMESELFGYEKGAFTGASKEGKIGLFELANKGTIFLDEVSELPLDMQVKLLKVIQDMTVFRLGGSSSTPIDVRIIAATNKNLEDLIGLGQFREDLYYRLNVIPITIPPLRERRDDIIPLCMDFLNKLNKKYNMSKHLTPDCLNILGEYQWHGNIRELKNLIERLVVTSPCDEITQELLPRYISKANKNRIVCNERNYEGLSLKEAREKFEKDLIESTIKEYGSARKAAKVLKVNPSTIGRKLNNQMLQ